MHEPLVVSNPGEGRYQRYTMKQRRLATKRGHYHIKKKRKADKERRLMTSGGNVYTYAMIIITLTPPFEEV